MYDQIIHLIQNSPWSITVPTTILLMFVMAIVAIAFFNKANKEAEVELNIWDKLKFKLRTTK